MEHDEEEKSVALLQVTNLFYSSFSRLIGQHLSMVPPELRSDLLYRLQDAASVFGADYDPHVVPAPDNAITLLLQQFEEENKSN